MTLCSLIILGLPSLNTRLDSYLVEKVAMCAKIGSKAIPLSVSEYLQSLLSIVQVL